MSAEEGPALSFYNRGCKLLGEGSHAEALEMFQTALTLAPGWALAHANLRFAWVHLAKLQSSRAMPVPDWRLFYLENPFKDFPLHSYSLDLQGWGAEGDSALEEIIVARRPSLIIEVGSWKGRSAISMTRMLQQHRIDGRIICIDTFLGSPEHLIDAIGLYPLLGIKHGRPTLYEQFLANVLLSQVQEYIIPMPQTSAHSADLLTQFGIQASMIYIDAAHDYFGVKHDLEMFWPLLASGGVLVGDDYTESWPGVVRAADEFAAAQSLELTVRDFRFVLTKPQ